MESGFRSSGGRSAPPIPLRRSRLPSRPSPCPRSLPPPLSLISPRRDLVSLLLARSLRFPSSRPEGLDSRSPPPLASASPRSRPSSPSLPVVLSRRFDGLRRRSLSDDDALGEPERDRAIPTDADSALRGASSLCGLRKSRSAFERQRATTCVRVYYRLLAVASHAPRLIFFAKKASCIISKILVFEFQMKKDGERGIGEESSRARRRESALLRVAHPPTSVSGLNADDISRVVDRSHVSPGARVRSFVASVRDHTGCQPRNSSGLPWRVLQSVSEARLRPGACVKDGR